MSRIYVSHDAGHYDLSPALVHGTELIPVFKGNVYPDDNDFTFRSKIERARSVLSSFDPKTDKLCLVGAPLFAATCGLILGAKLPSRWDGAGAYGVDVTLLRFDKMHKGYYPLIIEG